MAWIKLVEDLKDIVKKELSNDDAEDIIYYLDEYIKYRKEEIQRDIKELEEKSAEIDLQINGLKKALNDKL